MPLTVNGEAIDEEVIRTEEEQLRPRLREAMPDEKAAVLEERTREWARENAIERVLLRQAAASGGESVEDFTARLTAKLVPPRSKEIGEYYRRNRDSFVAPELLRAAHIIKNVVEQAGEEAALTEMRAIQAELEAGADFGELADRRSDCPGKGGDLGYFARGQMVPEFDSVVFALQDGQSSDIFRTPFGFHIAKVLDRKPAGLRPLADVREEIAALLFDQKKQRRIEQFLDGLRAKAIIGQ